jgi:hypothetical protein
MEVNGMSIEAMQLALEALEHEANIGNDNAYQRERDALRAAIAEAEKQEPHRLTSWGFCSVCKHDKIPGEGCARKDCPEAPAAQPAQQEPVAWAVFEGWNAHDLYLPQEYDEALKMAGYKGEHAEVKPLYTTPPAAQRQPLTEEQRRNIVRANKMRHDSDEIDPYGVIDDVEAAHGITGEKK